MPSVLCKACSQCYKAKKACHRKTATECCQRCAILNKKCTPRYRFVQLSLPKSDIRPKSGSHSIPPPPTLTPITTGATLSHSPKKNVPSPRFSVPPTDAIATSPNLLGLRWTPPPSKKRKRKGKSLRSFLPCQKQC